MGDPHNPSRYGELWDPRRLATIGAEVEAIQDLVVLSGGWAWHFISPAGHVEYKHAHDHKDVDLFVDPERVGEVVARLKGRGYEKVWTKYDRLPSEEDFRRYERTVTDPDQPTEAPIKVMIDFFVKRVPSILIGGATVVEPSYLLGLYKSIHSSDACFAVLAAKKLIDAGISPIGRAELVEIPPEE